jgi:hypothetical protein
VVHLIKMWLDCPVEEIDQRGRKKRICSLGVEPVRADFDGNNSQSLKSGFGEKEKSCVLALDGNPIVLIFVGRARLLD